MKKIIIEEDFWNLFPNAEIGVVVAKNIDNNSKDESKYRELLDNAQKIAYNSLDHNIEFSQNAVVQQWRQAFQTFKTKKGARSSIEALLKRISKGDSINSINPLVDIYNSISLKYQLPCGAEDIDKIQGNMLLTTANGDESFITYGSDESEPPYPGELVYKDDAGAICRCLNWREGVRTIVEDDTKNVELCIETLDSSTHDKLESALKELSTLIKDNLGGEVTYKILTKDNPEIDL